MIHVVVCKIVATGAGRADPAHGPRQKATRRIAHHERQPSRAAISANNAEALDVMKTGIVGAVVVQSKADAGKKTLSTNPLRIAGKPIFQTGNENTSASAARSRST